MITLYQLLNEYCNLYQAPALSVKHKNKLGIAVRNRYVESGRDVSMILKKSQLEDGRHFIVSHYPEDFDSEMLSCIKRYYQWLEIAELARGNIANLNESVIRVEIVVSKPLRKRKPIHSYKVAE